MILLFGIRIKNIIAKENMMASNNNRFGLEWLIAGMMAILIASGGALAQDTDKAKSEKPAKPPVKKAEPAEPDESNEEALEEEIEADEEKDTPEAEEEATELEEALEEDQEEAEEAEEDAEEEEEGIPLSEMTVEKLFRDLVYYLRVAQFKMASDVADEIISRQPKPSELLDLARAEQGSIELISTSVVNDHAAVPLKKILGLLEQGRRGRARDGALIQSEIARLLRGARGRLIARNRLRDVHRAYAVPYLVSALSETKNPALSAQIAWVLPQLGRPGLEAILASLPVPHTQAKIILIRSLGQIGYPQALPYLKSISEDTTQADPVRAAATSAFKRIDARGQFAKQSAADMFILLAERYYTAKPGNLNYGSDPRLDSADVWRWRKGTGLVRVEVPTVIYGDVMAQRCSELALSEIKNGKSPLKGRAIALWLSAAIRLESALPAGKTNPLYAKGHPSAAYYATAAGPRYLKLVLSRALKEKTVPVALGAISALEGTAGMASMTGSGAVGAVLIQAMDFPRREVRFASAFALTSTLPKKPFPGSDRIVPALVEAASQRGGKAAVVIVKKDQDSNKLVAGLREAGFRVRTFTSIDQGLDDVINTAGTDLIAIQSVLVGQAEDLKLLTQRLTKHYSLKTSPTILLTAQEGLAEAQQIAAMCPSLTAMPAGVEVGELAALSAKLSAEIGRAKMPDDQALAYAIRAVDLLRQIAVGRAPALDFRPAQSALISLVADPADPLAVRAAGVLALIDDPTAQRAIAQSALKAADDSSAKPALLTALAESARFHGNQLTKARADKLITLSDTATDDKLRTAATTALGALNLPVNQAKALILKQADIQ